MVKTINKKRENSSSYQEALDDFGITELLLRLSGYNDVDFNASKMNLEPQELASLATILIERLSQNLTGKLIASYLNAIRHGESEVLADPIPQGISLASNSQSVDFSSLATPCYQEGDRIKWCSIDPEDQETDWGIVIGRFYAYAQHRSQWVVCYLIKLDPNSPSAAWTVTDTAWEEDVEPNFDPCWQNADLTPGFSRSAYPTQTKTTLTKSVHTPPGNYQSGNSNDDLPRSLAQREEYLISLYSHCKLGMTPRQFYQKWDVTYEMISHICCRSLSTVRRWFRKGNNYRRPMPNDLRHLALMDFLLEHFEEIPEKIFNLLCSSGPNSWRTHYFFSGR
ncbi:MAG: hypothetical protein WA919_25680 [Coleofasciculaceae cyanobacterium]